LPYNTSLDVARRCISASAPAGSLSFKAMVIEIG
jgi:hypothetical protein